MIFIVLVNCVYLANKAQTNASHFIEIVFSYLQN